MKAFFAAMIIALLAGPAFAQNIPVPRYGEPDKDKTTQEKQAERDAANAYQRSLGSIPAKADSDPWGTVRSEPGAPKHPPKAASKGASSKAARSSATTN